MARRRVQQDEINFEDEAEKSGPVAIEHHKVVRTYTKEVPLEDVEEASTANDDDGDDDAEEGLEIRRDPSDPIELLLREMGASQTNWFLTVHRLPNYDKDGRSDPMTKHVYCGKVTLTAESIESGEYEQEIQNRWAREGKANHFRLQIKKKNRIFGYLPVLSLEPADPEIVIKQQVTEASAPQVYVPPNPQEAFTSFIKQAKQFAELREIFAPGSSLLPAAAPVASGPMTTESALVHLIATDETLIESIGSKLRGLITRTENGAREAGFIDLLLAAIQNDTLPKMIRETKSLIQEVQNVPSNAPPPNAPPAMSQIPSTPAAGPAPPGPEMILLQFAAGSCAAQSPPDSVANWVIEFEQNNPSTTFYINTFLGMAPQEALNWLVTIIPQAAPLLEQPHASPWIEALQNELRKEESDEETTTPGQPAA